MSYPPITPHSRSGNKKPTSWLQWWYQLPSAQQDRIIALTPLIALVVFIGFILLSYLHLNKEQYDREIINTQQSIATVDQQLHLLLIDNEDLLQNIALEVSHSANQEAALSSQAIAIMKEHPEVTALQWHNITDNKRYAYSNTNHQYAPEELKTLIPPEDIPTVSMENSNSNNGKFIFSYHVPSWATLETPLMYVSTSSPDAKQPPFLLIATYDLDRLLRKLVPAGISLYTAVWFEDQDGKILASTNPQVYSQSYGINQPPSSNISIDRFGGELILYAQSTQMLKTLTASFLFWFTAGLCFFISALLLLNWRHIRQFVQAQNATQRESNFRRAIENSITTGLQAFDLQGRIIYVNSAFCQMLGYQENELIGSTPPYAYWPQNMHQEYIESLEHVVLSQTQSRGREIQLQRCNGELFFAKLYTSPLIDETSQQNGWIMAITDISESKRSREELALAGQRFTTVLEGMDAAISVAAVGAKALLFTNNAYRHLFKNSEDGHAMLAARTKHFHPVPDFLGTIDAKHYAKLSQDETNNKSKEHLEIYLDPQDRWVEVRSQYLPWVDGRLAQMLITTDITEQHKAQEQAAIQAEQAAAVSRLITMGEMASSVAHELNQPLTAIHNYCSGLIRRIKNNALSQEELLDALEKTAKQASRAGTITQRIRAFVMKSAPKRILTPVTEIMNNIHEFAEMDSRKRDIKLTRHIEEGLPLIMVDPILIEQVLLNLVRNAVASIKDAHRPPEQRYIDMQVKRIVDENGVEKIEFSVLDSGAGMPEGVLKHMFEAFFTTKPNGLGIGLNLCRSIIESHGEHLYIDNIYNKDILTGCRFAFTLPIDALHKNVGNDIPILQNSKRLIGKK